MFIEKAAKRSEFEKLRLEYKDLPHTSVLLTDCKCSSGVETGLPKQNTKVKKNKKSKK